MAGVRLFAELPAGLASVSLRLHGGPHCRPPISRQGSKQGYAEVILGALGLRSGQGAGAYLWAEADPDVAALLRCYPDAAMLRRVAEIIRGWADEEPRALWERLRAERKARGPRGDAEGTAGWIAVAAGSQNGVWGCGPRSFENYGHNPKTGEYFPGDPIQPSADACHTLANYAAETTLLHRWSFSEKGPRFGYGGPGCEVRTDKAEWTTADRDKALGCDVTAERFEAMAGEVAALTVEHAGTHPGGGGFRGGHKLWPNADGFYPMRGELADRVDTIERGSRWPPVLVLPTIPTAAEVAAWLGTPGDLEDVVVYSDPPYLGTTGYQSDIPRADVIATALDFAALGALVCVSEAEPLADLTGRGWHATETAPPVRGQVRGARVPRRTPARFLGRLAGVGHGRAEHSPPRAGREGELHEHDQDRGDDRVGRATAGSGAASAGAVAVRLGAACRGPHQLALAV